MMDLAQRAYDRGARLDPVVRSLLDTDFYKFLMLQMIWKLKRDTRVRFGLRNRSDRVRLADVIDRAELTRQLDHVRTLRFEKNELIWLANNTFYGKARVFEPAFIDFLRDFALGPYELREKDGQFELYFDGPWTHTTMWEVPCLAIVSELRARAAVRELNRFELDLFYARAKAKLWGKVERLQLLGREGPLRLGDFGTRRRHSFLWQRWCVEALQQGLGANFTGTSNVKLAMDLGAEAIGTNAHELPMVFAAEARTDEELRAAPYRMLQAWTELYAGNLLVLLPDTFGTSNFLAGAPDWAADWTGARPDSKPPVEAAEELIAWWRSRGRDPRDKLVILSDAMTIDSIEESVRALRDRVQVSIGWGTALTNDFTGCAPAGRPLDLKPASLVCKVFEADGRPAVKLSDNPAKFLGPADEVARYISVLGYEPGAAREA